jgi:hypothetical protein
MKGEDVLLCARITVPLLLPDNRTGECCECGWKVQFRPHAPAGRRMCADCAIALIDFDLEIAIAVPPRMLEDYLIYLKRQRQ